MATCSGCFKTPELRRPLPRSASSRHRASARPRRRCLGRSAPRRTAWVSRAAVLRLGRRGSAGGHADGQPDGQEPGCHPKRSAGAGPHPRRGHDRGKSRSSRSTRWGQRGDHLAARPGFDPRALAGRPAGSASPAAHPGPARGGRALDREPRRDGRRLARRLGGHAAGRDRLQRGMLDDRRGEAPIPPSHGTGAPSLPEEREPRRVAPRSGRAICCRNAR